MSLYDDTQYKILIDLLPELFKKQFTIRINLNNYNALSFLIRHHEDIFRLQVALNHVVSSYYENIPTFHCRIGNDPELIPFNQIHKYLKLAAFL